MTDSQYLTGGRLLEIIEKARRTDKAVEAAVEVLERHRECAFRVATVPKTDLVRIYRIRLANPNFPPGAVLGSERMLDDFDASVNATFAGVVVVDGATIVGIWLTPDLDRLVTLTVGRDQRWPDDDQDRPPRKAKGRR